MPSHYLIIVAGGSGSRMNNELPKQFIEVGGRSIIAHCIDKFRSFAPILPIVIAVHPDHKTLLDDILKKMHAKNITVCEGGATRFHSVKNALATIPDAKGIVGIHDAARPFVSHDTIRNCFSAAIQKGNAIPVVNVNETLRKITANESLTVPRSEYKIVQTPQCFSIPEIKKAFEQAYSEKFTDDAAVLESTGKKINLVEGNPENIKITFPVDLLYAKALLDAEQ
jgi:2-C-methyl-D-erythritol 4-phosphate cytidylyltransferase